MICYIDLSTGLSGDMMVGALLGAGWPERRMQEVLGQLAIPEARVHVETRRQHTLVGLGIRVEYAQEPPERSYHDVRKLLEASSLDPAVKARSLQLFERLADVEGGIHGIDPAQVHFHELGATDSIVDVVLSVSGFADLGVTRAISGPVPLSRGEVMTAHGKLPVPTPATLSLLRGAPIRWLPFQGEWLTPTGALLLSGLVDAFDSPPDMRLQTVGIGAGTRTLEEHPNIVRLLLGDGDMVGGEEQIGSISVIEADLDDMDPRLLAEAVDRLERAGALDVFRTPILMKKGRDGILLTVLCRPGLENLLGSMVLVETTTLGVRVRREFRRELKRWTETVETPYGPVRVKWSRPGGKFRATLEFEDLRARSRAAGVPLWEVERATLAVVDRGMNKPPPSPVS